MLVCLSYVLVGFVIVHLFCLHKRALTILYFLLGVVVMLFCFILCLITTGCVLMYLVMLLIIFIGSIQAVVSYIRADPLVILVFIKHEG